MKNKKYISLYQKKKKQFKEDEDKPIKVGADNYLFFIESLKTK